MITHIPFKILAIDNEGYHLLLKLQINGKVSKVIIDTGASKTVFDKTRIEKLVNHKNFDSHDQLSSGLGTNTMESQTTIIKKLKLCDLEILNYKTVLLDLSHVNQSYQLIGLKPIDGVLGSDILVKYNAVINYEKKMLTLKYKKSLNKFTSYLC